ncbi:Cytochrome b5-like heme/steroid binding domain [Yasminevirus sp. GU-2018]|uniref:Cytochrome b5-like heme/steroid binding domain n=1 Tax=Yasminevirus sp. GU-2018 TaxID=2420051 RepID=A0A5K0U7T4_9VIRU|nr:Cytochrome b5-like heme/steroid binding domain [Yasminevirus sp. GU-2018]
MQNPETKRLWKIHGKYYDLTDFMDKHPGGRTVLEACKGLIDSTPLFESYHSVCDMDKIKAIMPKYEVSVSTSVPTIFSMSDVISKSNQGPKYTFNRDGFYSVVTNRVREHFNKNSHHYNSFWLVKSIVQILMYVVAFTTAFWFTDLNFHVRCISAVVAGLMVVGAGFGVMHDASHFAVARSDKINTLLSRTWNGIALWDHQLWLMHHVVRHHSFTGDDNWDPDVLHLRPFVQKTPYDKRSGYISTALNFPRFMTLLVSVVFPGLFVGQCVMYHLMWPLRGRIWRMEFPKYYRRSLYETLLNLVTCVSFVYGGSLTVFLAYIVPLNILYFVGIFPDHDTQKTADNKIKSTDSTDNGLDIDWGEMQVRNSGNFATSNKVFTYFMGGINYQIEHHLFPSVCHVHYPAISSIVKKTCAEFNIPYVEYDSVVSAVNECLTHMLNVSDTSRALNKNKLAHKTN